LAMLNNPTGIVIDAAQNVYFSDLDNHRVRVLTHIPILSSY
jgi:hypothetical protein